MIRFIHSSDLHLGKRFGGFSGDLPGRLREARHAVIGCLAMQAREQGAATILLAGDTFDTETPGADIRRQAFAEMREHAPIRWVILPGNHDSLQATELWARMRAEAPPNVTLALDVEPISLAIDAVLLPAPCTTRRPGRDLTTGMDGTPTPDGCIRIGMAHGAIQSFSEGGAASDIIAPDRALRAGLAYLALGDWHGPLSVNARTYYCGAPEPDRFKHEGPGSACLVTVDGPAAIPVVRAFRTAEFVWKTLELSVLESQDAAAALRALLPEAHRRHALLRVQVRGRSLLAGRTALDQALDHVEPEFAHLERDFEALATAVDMGDLDRIDRAGALREAANLLRAEAEDEARTPADRELAQAALRRLYSYAQAVAP